MPDTKCRICKGPVILPGYAITCSEICHEILVADLETRFGKYKKVIRIETSVAYRVPLRYIIERGLKDVDLSGVFPVWDPDLDEERESYGSTHYREDVEMNRALIADSDDDTEEEIDANDYSN